MHISAKDLAALIPAGFTLGVATAAFQIEGALDEDGRGPAGWDVFAAKPGAIVEDHSPKVACDHYHRMPQDVALMKQLGVDSYRFSFAWPRIQPTGRGPANEAGLAFYERLVDGLIARGIRPVATLYHWDLPQALEDEGGWTNRATAEAFADYARIVGERLGDRISVWTTLNEPWCSAYLGYGSGAHAPGLLDGAKALAAVHHLNLAHGLAIAALREVVTNDPGYSITLNLHVIRPSGATGPEAARRIDGLANRVFLGPLLEGEYPADVIADTAEVTDWSFVKPGDTELIRQPISLLGVNYYSTVTVRMWDGESPRAKADGHKDMGGTPWPGSEDVEFLVQPGPYTAMGWNIDPSGLEDLLVALHEAYPALPLMVTENGAAFDDVVTEEADGPAVHDVDRIDYLRRHFTAAHRAMARGVDLRGYQVWSLMDNFEWGYGYSKRFGIVRVDYDTLERLPKDSAKWYAELIRTRSIPA